MGFTIYPAIDLRDGKCVRLVQGDYQRETIYHDDPVKMAKQWEKDGAKWLHLVDLDAARTGKQINLPVVEAIIQNTSISIQIGGGIRDMERLESLLEIGVSRVIIGSAVVDHPEFVQQALEKYASYVVIGIDARDGKVATHGWLQTSEIQAEDLAKQMVAQGAEQFIFTDITRDGMLSGTNIQAVCQIAQISKKPVIASGGVRSIEDIEALRELYQDGVSGVIIGKALYTGAVSLAEALQVGGQEVS